MKDLVFFDLHINSLAAELRWLDLEGVDDDRHIQDPVDLYFVAGEPFLFGFDLEFGETFH